MVFYSHLLQKALNSPTIVVITDRNDLDAQLYGQFSYCKEFLRQTPVQATSREDLKNLLEGRKVNGIFFTTMQKFQESEEPLSERRNIIVISDEAHRGQYGLKEKVDSKTGEIKVGLARIIRNCIPNATFIGFTGTPISQKDRSTREVFGNYIDGIELNDYDPDFNQGSSATKFVAKTGSDIKTIKSNRTYQLGIAFEDEYGRQTPVISDDSGLIKRAAVGGAPVGLQIKMGGSNPADSKNRITHYKYYIKDSSDQYYNLIVDNAYVDTQDSSFVWIAFPSYEVNKIKEDDEIILKRKADGTKSTDFNTFKVLDISHLYITYP